MMNLESSKTCTKCKKIKSFSEFYNSTRYKDGKVCWCRECSVKAVMHSRKKSAVSIENHRKSSEKYRKKNKKKVQMGTRKHSLKNNYNISLEDYEKIFKSQEGRCAICGSEDSKSSRCKHLHIDHCHITDKVRGLLCKNCNTSLGNMHDSPVLLRKAAKYLEDHS